MLDGLSKKEGSDKAIQILAQLTIPDTLVQTIQTAHQYVKGLAATSLDEGFTSEPSKNLFSSLARHEITMNFMNAEVPTRSLKGKGKDKEKSKGEQGGLVIRTPLQLNFPRTQVLGQKFHCTPPNSTVDFIIFIVFWAETLAH